MHVTGEEVEQLDPIEMPVHVLTAEQVAAARVIPTAPAVPTDTLASEEARLRGNVAYSAKRFEDAVAAYTEAIQADGSNGLIYGNRSAALLAMDCPQDALVDAKEMVSRLPEFPKAHFRLGMAQSAPSICAVCWSASYQTL